MSNRQDPIPTDQHIEALQAIESQQVEVASIAANVIGKRQVFVFQSRRMGKRERQRVLAAKLRQAGVETVMALAGR